MFELMPIHDYLTSEGTMHTDIITQHREEPIYQNGTAYFNFSQSKIHTYQTPRDIMLRLRNDLYCVEWGVKLYSLTHSGT